MLKRVLGVAVLLVLIHAPAWGQSVSGVRGISGGVGALFSLVGPGSLYVDNNGNEGYIYSFGAFETYNFRSASGLQWSGGQMTLGPQLTIGLIQGANQSGSPQSGSPIVFPAAPRQLPPLPDVESSLLSPTASDFP